MPDRTLNRRAGDPGPPAEDRLPHDHFNTDLFPVSERFDLWREGVAPLFESRLEVPDPATFQARMESYHLGELMCCIADFSPLEFIGQGQQADHFLVQLYLSGGYAGYNGDQPVVVEAGDISLLDLGRSLETRAPASRNLSVIIPREPLLALVRPRRLRHGTVLKANSAPGRILASHMLTTWENLSSARVSEVNAINRSLVGAVAGIFAGEGQPRGEAVEVTARATLAAIRNYIEAHLGAEDLGPARLCRHFALSRSRLYRLFAPLGGVAGYIRRQRLARCYQELSDGGDARIRIVDVALRWGFDSQSHFCRLFRQAFETTPSDVLAAARVGRASRTGMNAATYTTTERPLFHDWLREL